MAAYEAEGQSSAATSGCKDDELYSFLKDENIPKLDQVWQALTESDIVKPIDLTEINESDIKDICNENSLSVMIRRKLLNARTKLIDTIALKKYQSENGNSINHNNNVLIIKVSAKETEMEKEIDTMLTQIESFVKEKEAMINNIEKEEKETISMIENNIEKIMTQLKEYKNEKIREMNSKYNQLKTLLNEEMENGINLKQECSNVKEKYKDMFSLRNYNENESGQREEYLCDSYEKMNDNYKNMIRINDQPNESKVFYQCKMDAIKVEMRAWTETV